MARVALRMFLMVIGSPGSPALAFFVSSLPIFNMHQEVCVREAAPPPPHSWAGTTKGTENDGFARYPPPPCLSYTKVWN